MKHKQFKAGDPVVYVEIINATVMSQDAHGVTITFMGSGKVSGQPLTRRVSAKWLEHGHVELINDDEGEDNG